MMPACPIPARVRLPALATVLLLMAAGCSEGPATADPQPETTATSTSRATAGAGTPVMIMGAGDIAGDADEAGATAALIEAADPDAVFTTGDNAYPDGSRSDYESRYDPTWGAFKDRTHPTPGNHEYRTDDAAGYVDYFGAENVTNDVDGGLYYAWDVGNGWRAYAINTEISTSGAQLRWLRDDVAAHRGQHYILYGHSPRYTSSTAHRPSDDICPLWDELAATGSLEIVLAGHNHQYERFAPMDCSGERTADGARSFVIGSGGADLYGFGHAKRGSELRNNDDFGVFQLALYENSYEWEFIAAGRDRDGSDKVDTDNSGQILDKGSADV
jgi:3',5'-cyclic AMP phosphodiesterase CpdA